MTIGSDFEVFIYDNIAKEYISAIPLVPGTKKEPTCLSHNGFAIQHDNVLAEANIEPATSENDFVKNILFMKQHIQNIIGDMYSVDCRASAIFKRKYLMDKEAQEFGCQPDFNAYTGFRNPPIERPENITLRSAGFHIHIGYDNPNPEDNVKIIKMMDFFLGIPSVVMDTDKRRRKLYGKAGCFRPQPHGVEYRVLSSFFLSKESLIRWVYKNTILAIKNKNMTIPVPSPLIEQTINMGLTDNAEKIITKFNIPMPMEIKHTNPVYV